LGEITPAELEFVGREGERNPYLVRWAGVGHQHAATFPVSEIEVIQSPKR
jgi:hypothetical protein